MKIFSSGNNSSKLAQTFWDDMQALVLWYITARPYSLLGILIAPSNLNTVPFNI